MSPASPLVPTETGQDAAAPFEREDAAVKPTDASINVFGEPVDAGPPPGAGGFGIVWPAEQHKTHLAVTGKLPTAAADRPFRLSNDGAHRVSFV